MSPLEQLVDAPLIAEDFQVLWRQGDVAKLFERFGQLFEEGPVQV